MIDWDLRYEREEQRKAEALPLIERAIAAFSSIPWIIYERAVVTVPSENPSMDEVTAKLQTLADQGHLTEEELSVISDLWEKPDVLKFRIILHSGHDEATNCLLEDINNRLGETGNETWFEIAIDFFGIDFFGDDGYTDYTPYCVEISGHNDVFREFNIAVEGAVQFMQAICGSSSQTRS